jgi:hypothetical protein
MSLFVSCDQPAFALGRGNCSTAVELASNSSFVAFFNGCHRDPLLSVGAFGFVGNELRAWFAAPTLLLAASLAIVLLPFFQLPTRLNASPSDTLSRLHFSRFHAAQLLYRIAFAYSLASWLQVAVQQPSPCVCTDSLSTNPVPQLPHNGMPDADSAALMVAAAFVAEHVSLPLGLVVPLLFGAAQVVTGFYSVGQALTGLAMGGLLHLLQTRTPGFVRVIEFSLSLIGSVVAFVLIKRYSSWSDISPGAAALSGALWQLAALLLPLIWFDWTLVKETLRKSPHTLHPVDFLYYVPLLNSSAAGAAQFGRSGTVQFNLTEPEPDLSDGAVLLRKERRLLATTVVFGVLLLLLGGVRMAAPNLNSWFATKV